MVDFCRGNYELRAFREVPSTYKSRSGCLQNFSLWERSLLHLGASVSNPRRPVAPESEAQAIHIAPLSGSRLLAGSARGLRLKIFKRATYDMAL